MGLKSWWKNSVVPWWEGTSPGGWWVRSARPWLQRWEYSVLFGVIGLIFGFGAAAVPDLKAAAGQMSKEELLLTSSLIGLLVGLSVYPLYRWVRGRVWRLRIEEIETPLLAGVKIKIKVTDENRTVGWKIFVEATTRITTQPLGEKEGLIREALASMYKFFCLVRDELKGAKPSPPPANPGATQHTVESYAVIMLNDALRPMLSRWHPRLTAWEKAGLPESLWPLKEACRADVETTRKNLLAYTWGLGELFNVGGLEKMLGDKPESGTPPQLPTEDTTEVARRLMWLEPILGDPQRLQTWRVFVEAATRVAARPLDAGDGVLSEELASLQKLSEILRDELKSAPPAPTPPPPGAEANAGKTDAATAQGSQTEADTAEGDAPAQPAVATASLAACANHLLNEALRPMMARWGPRVAAWEKTGMPESRWPLAASCRHDLNATRKKILLALWELGGHLKVPDLKNLLPTKPDTADSLELTLPAKIKDEEAAIWASAGESSKVAGWRIFVELASRLAAAAPGKEDETPGENGKRVSEALGSLHELYGSVRCELKDIKPTAPPGAQAEDTVEGVALEILGGRLGVFLAEWYTRLRAWEEESKKDANSQGGAEPAWPQAGECAAGLAEVRADLDEKARRLAAVLGIPPAKFLGKPPAEGA